MIAITEVTKGAIRTHYDLATPFYRLLWGPHIHHGLWDEDEAPATAQLQLTRMLAAKAELRPGERVLDVGCGMGGSALHLAGVVGCDVLGLTLSAVQRAYATIWAALRGLSRRARFRRLDVEHAKFPAEQFDVLWSIECTEHLFDKAALFQHAARWLRPGGRVAICAWLAGPDLHTPELVQQVREVCEGFLCPSLGSALDYQRWIAAAGFEHCEFTDLTVKVARTWEICDRRVRRSGAGLIARLAGRDMTLFVKRFRTLLNAYRSGAMQYGCFVARKPG
jgi:cyclopropane fatty-acyl-phospholipid synthase-like methyltransferase